MLINQSLSIYRRYQKILKIYQGKEAYFKKGGMHVQVNTMGTRLLRDAQTHPENHEDLIVRVSGYAAYFTRLGKEIQDDIIERVEFTPIF